MTKKVINLQERDTITEQAKYALILKRLKSKNNYKLI